MLQQQIMREIQGIPEDKLAEIYNIIHYYRVGLENETEIERQPGILKGSLGNAFFDELPENELKQWE